MTIHPRWRPSESPRLRSICILALAVGGLLVNGTTPVFAEDVNPVPSDELCPDGSPRLVWNYRPEDGVPGNATSAECVPGQECWVIPASACLSIVEKTEDVSQIARLTVLTKQPEDESSLLKPQSPGPRGPVRTQPTAPFGEASDIPTPPLIRCSSNTGWDFENLMSPVLPTRGLLDGWIGSGTPFRGLKNADLDFPAAPVYGNAAPIDRIRPPG